VIVGNGFAPTGGGWGAQAGVALSSSPESVIERNLILGNREGFDFREQTRTTPRIGKKGEEPIWNHDQTIRKNVIAFNRDAQVSGWFDMKDGRHWPASESAQESVAKSKSGASESSGLTLEKLNLAFVDNVYFAGAGQGLIKWGVSWSKHKSFASLSEFQAVLAIDKGSRVLDPAFANLNALDLRLSPEVMKELSRSYPQGPVPGVLLGPQP